jgi:hypothetical protein
MKEVTTVPNTSPDPKDEGMSNGEIFVFSFVAIVFILGIYAGVRLYKWNKKDRQSK